MEITLNRKKERNNPFFCSHYLAKKNFLILLSKTCNFNIVSTSHDLNRVDSKKKIKNKSQASKHSRQHKENRQETVKEQSEKEEQKIDIISCQF